MAKKVVSLLIIFIFITGVFSSCKKESLPSPAPLGEKTEPIDGGVMKLACVYVDSMNPLTTAHASVSDFLSLIYEGLFVVNSDLTVSGILAENFSVSNNNTVYTINLKKGVTFHDGRAFSADDVVATLNYIALYSPLYQNFMQYVSGYVAEDAYKVVITLNTPKSDFINNLDFPILPSGLLESDFILPNKAFVPNGTGMYKYHNIESYKNIILKANASWHGGDRPHIEQVDIEIFSDEETIISAFDAGTIDALTTTWRGLGEINLTSTLFNSFESEQNRFTFVGINTRADNFDTAEKRCALWQSIDREKLTEDIMVGKAVVASSPARDGIYYNLQSDTASDSQSHSSDTLSPNKNVVECKLLYNSDSKIKTRIAMSMKQQLESKGYVVELDGQPLLLYTDKVLVGDYELYIGEVQLMGSNDLEFMFSSPMNGICNYDDSEFRTLLTNLDLAIGQKEKEVAWESFEKYYMDNAPQIPLYFTNKATFVNKRLIGSLKANLSVPFLGIDDMYIAE